MKKAIMTTDTTERGHRRFLFALYYALRDCTPQEREEVTRHAEHDATCSLSKDCAVCMDAGSQHPDWWPDAKDWDCFPYADLVAWSEREDEG